MFTIETKVTDKLIKTIIEDMGVYYSVVLTSNRVKKLLKTHPSLAIEIVDNEFDTSSRESFLEELALDLTGLSWPLNGDSKKIKVKFSKVFKSAVKRTNIKLRWDFSVVD